MSSWEPKSSDTPTNGQTRTFTMVMLDSREGTRLEMNIWSTVTISELQTMHLANLAAQSSLCRHHQSFRRNMLDTREYDIFPSRSITFSASMARSTCDKNNYSKEVTNEMIDLVSAPAQIIQLPMGTCFCCLLLAFRPRMSYFIPIHILALLADYARTTYEMLYKI